MSRPVNLRLSAKVALATVCCVLPLPACRGTKLTNDTGPSEIVTSLIPPFSTKEPERYRAVRTTTLGSTGTTTVLIAREGNKRRQEYQVSGKKIVYLEVPAGRYVLSPTDKLYADLQGGPISPELIDLSAQLAPVPISPPRTESRYQRLGKEIVAERPTIKYRVIATARNNEPASSAETFIWVDEILGIPIRLEMRRSGDNAIELLTELSEISFNVDESLFELPKDYRQVDRQAILGS